MLPAAQDSRCLEAGKKLARVESGLPGIRRDQSRCHHTAGSLKSQIYRRSEVHVEPQRPAILANDAAVLAKQSAIAHSELIGSGRRRADDVAQAVYFAAFQIDTAD